MDNASVNVLLIITKPVTTMMFIGTILVQKEKKKPKNAAIQVV